MSTRTSSNLMPVLISGSAIILVSFAIRASFGVFQIPIASEFGWLRAEFSFAIAIQNLFWGIGTPIFGAFADKFGDRKAIVAGALCYAAGLVLSSYAVTPGQHQLLEMLVGFGIAGTGFGVILSVIGRVASDENRSIALGIGTAAGSAGQIVGPVTAEFLLRFMPWQSVFIVFAVAILAILIVLPFIRNTSEQSVLQSEPMGVVLKKAVSDPTYTMIFIGFFSCGYQLGFITAHFPAFIAEVCGPIASGGLLSSMGISTTSALGALAIAVIGLANIFGTIAAGWLGQTYSRKYLLAAIYLARTVVAATFIIFPITPASVLIFSGIMGALWLATVPLTSGLVAQIYGLKYMGTLYGLVFFSHQLGGFLGVWLGGRMYDLSGDYTLVWWIGVGVGAFSALVHLPIDENPLEQRRRLQGAAA
ncbi:MFS transporter [Hoeflea prorocentri]|uniref:MFS transporter n=1 Tax=Hoeflea prorocentri TaxID=1922333 RepID=A0A9X3UN04_9HYPH|nr:MFS transporter [Hoeflea prorocentri]MCY6383692.1 MFS transporter [Hoeflea prorocentri]MDA5401492.1 MFS transporter [Hoeflea prorocentri]